MLPEAARSALGLLLLDLLRRDPSPEVVILVTEITIGLSLDAEVERARKAFADGQ